MTQALSARTQQDREGAVEQTWRTHKGDDDTSASLSGKHQRRLYMPKAQEMPGISGVGLEARSKFQERNWNFAAPEMPRVSGVGREAKTDSERNSNVKWLQLQSIVLGKHVSGVGREAAADSERIVGIDHCTALRPENERWITR
ncbi:hypothetical protein EDB19DRAFT_1826942 [Suillus lakei]|nr:hypothetical protein EDB19DRAFT_1826942 [Suillus lakei]